MKHKELIIFIAWGLFFALLGEIFNNFIILDQPWSLLLIITPIYILYFLAIGLVKTRNFIKPLPLCVLAGLFGLIIVENIIFKKYIEPWPIQIFMFSYWFSLASYPFLMVSKKYILILLPIIFAILTFIVAYFTKQDLFLTLAITQFIFWIVSALNNIFCLIKKTQ